MKFQRTSKRHSTVWEFLKLNKSFWAEWELSMSHKQSIISSARTLQSRELFSPTRTLRLKNTRRFSKSSLRQSFHPVTTNSLRLTLPFGAEEVSFTFRQA